MQGCVLLHQCSLLERKRLFPSFQGPVLHANFHSTGEPPTVSGATCPPRRTSGHLSLGRTTARRPSIEAHGLPSSLVDAPLLRICRRRWRWSPHARPPHPILEPLDPGWGPAPPRHPLVPARQPPDVFDAPPRPKRACVSHEISGSVGQRVSQPLRRLLTALRSASLTRPRCWSCAFYRHPQVRSVHIASHLHRTRHDRLEGKSAQKKRGSFGEAAAPIFLDSALRNVVAAKAEEGSILLRACERACVGCHCPRCTPVGSGAFVPFPSRLQSRSACLLALPVAVHAAHTRRNAPHHSATFPVPLGLALFVAADVVCMPFSCRPVLAAKQ